MRQLFQLRPDSTEKGQSEIADNVPKYGKLLILLFEFE